MKNLWILAVVVGAALAFNVKGVELDDFEFTMEERLCERSDAATLVDIDFTDATKWAKTYATSQCELLSEDDISFVRFSTNGYSFSHSVGTATNYVVTPGEALYIDTTLRVPQCGDHNTAIIYVRMFDQEGNLITSDPGAPSGWSYTTYSDALAKYPIRLSVSNEWESLSYKLVVPNGVYAIKPLIALWLNCNQLDCCRLGLRTTGERFSKRVVDMNALSNENLRVELELEPTNRQQLITATIIDLNTNVVKRCFDLHLKWKHDLTNWRWHKDWRTDIEITADSELSNVYGMGGFPVSYYSMTAVSSPAGDEHYLLGTPLNEKVYEHRVVTADGIESSQPLGIWVRGYLGRTNVFHWVFASFDGDWGFRSAAKEYLRTQSALMPAIGVGNGEGAWVWLKPELIVENHEDFGQYFLGTGMNWKESSTNFISETQAKGLAVFPYIEPWGMRVQIGENHVYERAGQENSAMTLSRVCDWATNATAETWVYTNKQIAAQALLNSMPYQPNGKLAYSDDYYDCWNRWLFTVADPRITHPNVMDLHWLARTGIAHELMDGIVFDSVTYDCGNYRNEREEHLQYFDRPLVYDSEVFRPCTDGMQHLCDAIGFAAHELHPKRKRVWGNIFGIAYRFCASDMDVYGSEVGNWGNSDANTNMCKLARTSSDSDACMRRFYAYHRPIGNQLFNGTWNHATLEMTQEGVLAYIENQMLYGFYPGLTSIGGDEEGDTYATWKRYFDSRKRYERDRDLFKAAIPVIKRMNKVGWEPETGLVADTNVVQIERYGGKTKLELIFAIHNDSEHTITTRLSRAAAEGVEFKTLEPIYKAQSLQAAGDDWTVEIAPWQTIAVKGAGDSIDQDGVQAIHGSGILRVTAEVMLAGDYEGILYIAEGARVKLRTGYGIFTNLVVYGEGTLELPANRDCWPTIADDFTGAIIAEEAPATPTGTIWELPNATFGETFAIQMTNVVAQAAAGDTIRIAPGNYSMEDLWIESEGKALNFVGNTLGWWDGQVVISGNACFYRRGTGDDAGTRFWGITFAEFGEGVIRGEANVTAEDCVFARNRGTMLAVVELGANGRLDNCRFENNLITNKANACGLLANGGAVNDFSRFQIDECTFVSNIVWKGGIVRGLACTNCQFLVNEVPYSGAVVYRAKAVGCRLLGNRKWDSYCPTGDTKYSGAHTASDPGCDGHSSQFVACTMDGGVINNCVLNRCVIPSCTNAGSYCVFYGGGNYVTNTLVTGRLGNRSSRTAFRGIIYDWGGIPTKSKFVNCTFAELAIEAGMGYSLLGPFAYHGGSSKYPIDFINCICHRYRHNDVDKDFLFSFAKLTNSDSGVSMYNCLAGAFSNATSGVTWSNFTNNQTIATADQGLDSHYAPQPYSAACSAGDSTGFSDTDLDLAGNRRTYGDRVDLGCYQVSTVGIRAADKTIVVPVEASATLRLADALADAGLTIADINGGDYADYAIVKRGEGILLFPSPDDGGVALVRWRGDLRIVEGVVKVCLPDEPTDTSYAYLLGMNSMGKVEVANGASLYIETSGTNNVGSLCSGIARPIYLAGAGTADYPGALTLCSKGSSYLSYRRAHPDTVYLNDDATVYFLKNGNGSSALEYKNRFLCGHTLTYAAYAQTTLISNGNHYPGADTKAYDPDAKAIFDNVRLQTRAKSLGVFRNYAVGNELIFRNNGGYYFYGGYGETWQMVFEPSAYRWFNDNNPGMANVGIATNVAGMTYGSVVLNRDLQLVVDCFSDTDVETKVHNTGFLGAISGPGGLSMSAKTNYPYANTILSLAGSNTFTGPLTLSGVTLALFNANAIPQGEDAGAVTFSNCEVAVGYEQANAESLRFPTMTFDGEGRIYSATNFVASGSRVSFDHLTKTGEGILDLEVASIVGDFDVQGGAIRSTGNGWYWQSNLDIVATAVNAADLAWSTGGAAEWAAIWTTKAADGVHAAHSGAIGDDQESVLTLQVEGKGTLSFDWRVSCEERYDALHLEVDGETIRKISGETSWAKVAVELGVGSHTVRWIYKKGRSKCAGDDCAWLDNVSWSLAMPPTLAEALDDELEWSTDGDGDWTAIRDESAAVDDDFAYVAGLEDSGVSTIRTHVNGAGRLQFSWVVSCEADCDFFDFSVDGVVWYELTGVNDRWQTLEIELGDGDHTFEWTYWKDNADAIDDDIANCAMLDGVIWTSNEPVYPELREVPVNDFYVWLQAYNLLAADAPTAAAVSLATTATSGKSTTLIEEYIIGTNPTNSTDTFTALINLVEGKPVVTWHPDLNGDHAREGVRRYRVKASNVLTDDLSWVEIDDTETDRYQFFRVTVEMPQ